MSNKNSTWKWNLLMIAAGVAATAASASAQQGLLQADIPFAFSINRSANLEAGSYTVAQNEHVLRFRNLQTGEVVLAVNAIGREGKAGEKPSLTFACVGKHCQIRAIKMGGTAPGAELPAPHLSKSDKEELAVVNIPLEPSRGE